MNTNTTMLMLDKPAVIASYLHTTKEEISIWEANTDQMAVKAH